MGADVIGMTAMPEAKLAREAELPYALIGMVTDYDCWREDEAHVEVGTILAQLHRNAATARALVAELAAMLPEKRTASPIDTVLDQALITHISHVDRAKAESLGPVVSRVLAARAVEDQSSTIGLFLAVPASARPVRRGRAPEFRSGSSTTRPRSPSFSDWPAATRCRP